MCTGVRARAPVLVGHRCRRVTFHCSSFLLLLLTHTYIHVHEASHDIHTYYIHTCTTMVVDYSIVCVVRTHIHTCTAVVQVHVVIFYDPGFVRMEASSGKKIILFYFTTCKCLLYTTLHIFGLLCISSERFQH